MGQLTQTSLRYRYDKARMYLPSPGRFLQTDPIGYKDDLNWYAYVGNNPANLTDPSGFAAASAKAFNNSTLGNATAFEFRSAGFSNGPSYQTAMAPFVAAFAVGMALNSIANDDVPMIGGGVVKGTGAAALSGARAARDAFATSLAPLKGKAPATATAGYNVKTGEVAARACTEAVRPRTGVEVPICPRCEATFGRQSFPPNTRFKSDQ